MERAIRQKHTKVRRAWSHRDGHFLPPGNSPRKQQNRRLTGKQEGLCKRWNFNMPFEVFKVRIHQCKGLVLPALSFSQFCYCEFIASIEDELESADPLQCQDLSFPNMSLRCA